MAGRHKCKCRVIDFTLQMALDSLGCLPRQPYMAASLLPMLLLVRRQSQEDYLKGVREGTLHSILELGRNEVQNVLRGPHNAHVPLLGLHCERKHLPRHLQEINTSGSLYRQGHLAMHRSYRKMDLHTDAHYPTHITAAAATPSMSRPTLQQGL